MIPLFLQMLFLLTTTGWQQTSLPAGQDSTLNAQRADYANARKTFRTHLIHQGPSPQDWARLRLPRGVAEIQFHSGALKLSAWINRPANVSKKYPAVLFLHGGFAFGEDDWEMAQPYRDAGFVVMAPRLRGENGQPGNFTFFYDEVDDVLAAADYLRSLPFVDSEQVFIAGHSSGGTLTLLAALASNKFRAAASFSGSPDQVAFLSHSPDMRDWVPFDMTDKRELEMRSPLAFASGFRCPLRIYFGTDEAPWFQQMNRRAAVIAGQAELDAKATGVSGDHFGAVSEAVDKSIVFFREVAQKSDSLH